MEFTHTKSNIFHIIFTLLICNSRHGCVPYVQIIYVGTLKLSKFCILHVCIQIAFIPYFNFEFEMSTKIMGFLPNNDGRIQTFNACQYYLH